MAFRKMRKGKSSAARRLLDTASEGVDAEPKILKPVLDLEDVYGDYADNQLDLLMANQLVISANSTRTLFPKTDSSPNEIARYIAIESLIDLIAQYEEQDPKKQRELYLKLSQQFKTFNLIGESYKLNQLHQLRRRFGNLLINVNGLKLPSASNYSLVAENKVLNSPVVGALSPDRYVEDFTDELLIAEGGFGKVYQAKHVLDGGVYAVKKITFMAKSLANYHRILREVQLYANLPSHPHIINYKTTWLDEQRFVQQVKTVSVTEVTESDDGQSIFTTNETVTECDQSSHLSVHSTGGDSFTFDKSRESNGDDSILFEETSSNSIKIKTSKTVVELSSENKLQQESIDEISITHDPFSMYRSAEPEVDGDTDSKKIVHPITVPILAKRSRTMSERSDSAKSCSDSLIDYGYLSKAVQLAKPTLVERPFCSPPNSELQFRATLYIQMELCGENLQTWIKKRNEKAIQDMREDKGSCAVNYINLSESLDIFRQIVKGVEFLHSHNLLHRDLKPQNILFCRTGSGKVKIGDFGLATIHEDIIETEVESFGQPGGQTMKGDGHTNGLGTTVYAAPEQKARTNYDTKADIYSLGIILLEMVYPFAMAMEKNDVIKKLKTGSLPDELEKWPIICDSILAMTRFRPKQRPSASEILQSQLFPSKNQRISDLKKENKILKEENHNLKTELSQLKKLLEKYKRSS
ncbi:Eukaryotic translation initiation factor 2-alpha kinase 1 [Halotydeus destructor]|nr:Eukaryotic translation initiation factor 2-alpha kinase 1 [Halotydeus destructor]